MKRSALTLLEKTQGVLFAITAVMIAAVLGMALQSRSSVVRSCTKGTYTAVDDVVTTQLDGQSECRFTLGDIGHADTLAFYLNHHEI